MSTLMPRALCSSQQHSSVQLQSYSSCQSVSQKTRLLWMWPRVLLAYKSANHSFICGWLRSCGRVEDTSFTLLFSPLYSFIVYSSISLWTNPTQTSKTSIFVFVCCVWQHNHNLQAFCQAHLFLFFGGGVYKNVFYYFWHFSHTASVSDQQAPVPRSGRASVLVFLFPCMLNPPLALHSLPTSLTCCFFLLLPLCLASQRSSYSDWQFSLCFFTQIFPFPSFLSTSSLTRLYFQ